MMFGDEARMKAEFFGLDVGIDDPLEPTGALGGIHAARHGRAAEQSKSHGKISWSGSTGGGSRHRRIDSGDHRYSPYAQQHARERTNRNNKSDAGHRILPSLA
jgi:hypothetical protein